MANNFKLKDVEALAEEFAKKHLDEYVEEISNPNYLAARKEINDALWGTISLTPAEVIVLDSPLLQRLRYIRQLGVVHWVYPGAIHTRFEHTLGVLYQVQNLVSALNNAQANASNIVVINTSLAQILRLCALLHDVGHAAFSHVSEIAVESMPEANVIAAEFAHQKHIERRNFSEIFAYYVIQSQSMQSFMQVLLQRYGHITLDSDPSRNLKAVINMLSNAIIGNKIDDRLPLLHEIISGPFDADKLDYFTRDSKLAGTPSVLDISRLVQKISVREMDSHELPIEISRNVAQLEGKHYLFGVKWSGVAVLDELHLARVLLYAKIYRHPKVITIEQMLRAVILTIAKLAPLEKIISLLYSSPDDALLTMTDSVLASSIGKDFSLFNQEEKERLVCAARTLKAIRDRRLWVRAFQLQRRYPSDALELNEGQKNGLISFREDIEHPQNRESLVKELIEEICKILPSLNDGVSDDFNPIALESSLMIHALGQTPGGTQIARAYLMPTSGKPIPYREYTVNRTAWADAYHSDQPTGYIFCPTEIADAVYIAIEKIIRQKYGIKLPLSAMEASKRNADNIKKIKNRLVETQYYHSFPFDLRPALDRLQRADVPGIIENFVSILTAYQEPPLDECESIQEMENPERIKLWLRQFDDNHHVDCALKLLAKFRMINRQDAVNALKQFIVKNSAFHEAYVVPLGGGKDSGAIHAYYSVGVASTVCATLEEAASGTNLRPVIFIDDFIGSGNQVRDILCTGFGLQDDRIDLGEKRLPYTADVQKYLKSVEVAFVFTAGWDEGIKNAQEVIRRLGINGKIFRLIDEAEIPFAFENCLNDVETSVVESFKKRCIEIGASLLNGDEKTQDRVLGYGNRAMLLSTPFNVPTQTLTAVWKTGYVDDILWSPLMARRKKK